MAYHVSMDSTRLKHFIEAFWEDSILPSITEYIRIPNKSPAYDPLWVEHGYMEDAVTLMEGWARPQLEGLRVLPLRSRDRVAEGCFGLVLGSARHQKEFALEPMKVGFEEADTARRSFANCSLE